MIITRGQIHYNLVETILKNNQANSMIIMLIVNKFWFSSAKAKLLQLKLIHLFARELFLIKKLEIEKLSPL